jgi:hypothetical protein
MTRKETLALNVVATTFKLEELARLLRDTERIARVVAIARLEEQDIMTLQMAMTVQAATLAIRLREQLATLRDYQHEDGHG